MTSAQTMSLAEIQRTGLEALVQKMGTVGMIRFLQLWDTGQGDYTAEREQWLGNLDVADIVAKIKEKQATPPQAAS